MSPDAANIRVAVLGLGACYLIQDILSLITVLTFPGIAGVGTLKNLVEAGFDAVGFERNEYIGGLWQWTSNKNITSATKSKQYTLAG